MIRKLCLSLYGQVLIAIIIGVLVGHFYPNLGVELKPLGDGFIKLIKMIIAPVIFCTVVSGIAGMDNMKKLGSVGVKALIYFEVVTTIALIIGLVVISLLKPGVGMHVDIQTLDAGAVVSYANPPQSQGIVQFLLNIIPANVVDAFAKGELLQVLFFAVLFGVGLSLCGEKARMIFDMIDQLAKIFFQLVHLIMRVAPIGAFGAMAFTIGKYGVETLSSLGMLIVSFYMTCAVFVGVVLGGIAKLHGFSIWKYLKYIKEELLIVLGTSSSESAMPRLMQKLENAGCSKSVVGLVMPAGYSFNLDGTCIYFTMAILFIAQATDISLSLTEQLTILAVLLVTSKGAAGVTGSGFITLAATLSTINTVPVAGLALILGIDRFMSEARAITNIIGNGVATLVIAKWEKEWDESKAVGMLK